MKQTVEEAAFEYSRKWGKYNTYKEPNLTSLEFAFQYGADWQAKQYPWISVEERLPEEDGYYVVTDGNFPTVAYFFKEWNRFSPCKSYPHLFFEEGVIKAYMPIPSFDQILETNKDVLQRMK